MVSSQVDPGTALRGPPAAATHCKCPTARHHASLVPAPTWKAGRCFLRRKHLHPQVRGGFRISGYGILGAAAGAHLHSGRHAGAQQQRQRARKQRVPIAVGCKSRRPARRVCLADALQAAPAFWWISSGLGRTGLSLQPRTQKNPKALYYPCSNLQALSNPEVPRPPHDALQAAPALQLYSGLGGTTLSSET